MTFQEASLRLVSIVAISMAAACTSEEGATPGPDGSTPETGRPEVGKVDDLLAQLTQARATWSAAKASCTTYHYVNQHPHFPFGGCTRIDVEIADDHPTRRRSYDGRGGCADPASVMWDETASDIGSHAGFPAALTVEQLFDDCQQILSTHDPAQYDLRLMVGAMGVPQLCGYTPKNCADDCFTGFDLAGFACGALPPPPPVDGGGDTRADAGSGATAD